MSQPNQFVPFIPDNAPFSTEQRAWLNGFLAGMFSQQPAGGAAAAAAPAVKATVLYGSQTGNAEALASQTAKQLKSAGVDATAVDMEAFEKAQIVEEENLILLTSTYGDGEPPDNAADLHAFLMDESAPKLDKTAFAVFGLGDTSYPEFCKCAKDFDSRLEALGARRLLDRVDADVDFEEPFESWVQKLGSTLADSAAVAVEPEAVEVDDASAYGKKNPFPARIVENLNLNGEESAKETRHVAISLEGSGLSYEAGDALAVLPLNKTDLIEALISKLELDPATEVTGADGSKKPLVEALRSDYEITNVTAKLAASVLEINGSDTLKALVEDKAAFDDYCWGRDLLDLVTDYPVKFETGEAFVSILKKLASRLYSISSSPDAHPGEVHVTVGRVSYEKEGRTRYGVCSDYLACTPEGDEVKVFTHTNKNFRPPADLSGDAIMVGPGTGIAPFRAFLEDRIAKEATGRNWLFFGDQKCDCDFLYRETLESWFKDGKLHRLDTAFSRDQAEKIYVQDRMREQGAELFAWLQAGASFFVCGDASRMAKDVDTALHDVIAEHGDMSAEDAAAFVKTLKSEKRYQRDVY
ncbi:MAG: assimilatory sulfite reductase (NADPH) flavoprotein subunit [Verrucomicrobiota bacterium]